jgi:hypothetical protein
MFHFTRNPIQHIASSIRRLWRSRQVIDPTVDDRLNILGEQAMSLCTEISSLERFIVGSPKSIREHRLHMMNTLPAPDEMMAAPTPRLSRHQMRSIRMRRYKDLGGFVFLLLALGAVLTWLGYQLTFYSIL